MKNRISLILPLLALMLITTLSHADDAIEQDVSSLFEGMDTSALDGGNNKGAGNTAENTQGNNGMIHFDFAYGSESGLYGPISFNLTKRNLKKLERKLAKDEKKLSRAGNMSLKVLVRIEMNRQLISALKSSANFKSGKGCKVYFDVAALFEKANNDAAFNRQLVSAAARSMGNNKLAKAIESGDYSAINGSGVASAVGGSVRNSVQSSVRSSVQQSVQNEVSKTATQEATSGGSSGALGGGGGSGGGGGA